MPEPVGAWISVCFPHAIAGQPSACAGVGPANAARTRPASPRRRPPADRSFAPRPDVTNGDPARAPWRPEAHRSEEERSPRSAGPRTRTGTRARPRPRRPRPTVARGTRGPCRRDRLVPLAEQRPALGERRGQRSPQRALRRSAPRRRRPGSRARAIRSPRAPARPPRAPLGRDRLSEQEVERQRSGRRSGRSRRASRAGSPRSRQQPRRARLGRRQTLPRARTPRPRRAREAGSARRCVDCTDRDDLLWRNDRWQQPPPGRRLPSRVLGVMRPPARARRGARALHGARRSAVGDIGRVHVCRSGDQRSPYRHWWFMARPARLPQLLGSFAAIWDAPCRRSRGVWQANVDAAQPPMR